MIEEGWIKLYRHIRDCWIWQSSEPFDRRSAWVDLLMMANYEDKKVSLNGNPIIVKTGSFITSEAKLAERWRWSRRKVDTFLKALEADGSIVAKKSNKCTAISLVNWDKYQHMRTADAPQTHSISTADAPQTHTDNKVKIFKNITPPMIPREIEVLHQDVQAVFLDFISDRSERKQPMTSRAIALSVKELCSLSPDKNTQIDIINQSIRRGWNGFFALNKAQKTAPLHKPSKIDIRSARKYDTASVDKTGARNLLDNYEHDDGIETGMDVR